MRRTAIASASHVYFGPDAFQCPIEVRRIGPSDCFAALKESLRYSDAAAITFFRPINALARLTLHIEVLAVASA